MSSAHRYLDVLDRVAEAHANAKSAKSAKSGPRANSEAAQNSQISQNSHARPVSKRGNEQNPYGSIIAALEARCPDLVPVDRWQKAVADGKTFLARWGGQAHALGWTAKDLFGLLPVPEHAKPSFNRLSRYDETGLIWLLDGRRVVALSEDRAAVQSPSGNATIYRKLNKPALGPLGDSLDDYHAPPSATDARPFHSPPARCHPGDLSGSAESEQ